MERNYYLRSQTTDEKVFQTNPPINKDEVKEEIITHLANNPEDTLEWCVINKDPKYVGDDILGFYEINKKSGKPSKVITKGNKEFYKPLV
jgi:hypothetical protein